MTRTQGRIGKTKAQVPTRAAESCVSTDRSPAPTESMASLTTATASGPRPDPS